MRPGRLAAHGERLIESCWNRCGGCQALQPTYLGDGPALGPGDEGGEEGWRWPWLRFLAGLEILLSNRNEGERSPHASGSEADVLQQWGEALS